jgi:flagellar hook-basal body complex protein FliE
MDRIDDDLPLRGPQGYSIPSARSIGQAAGAAPSVKSGASFKDSVQGFLSKVNDMQLTARNKAERFAAGEEINLHEVMIAQEQASLAFQMTQQFRNKILEAYQEVMRTQI